MAMPFIIFHDENIYSLEEKAIAKLKKPPRYTSTYKKTIISTSGMNKYINKTMGYPEVPLNPPDNYLKIGGGIHVKAKTTKRQCTALPRPPIPKKIEIQKPEPKDFKKQNATNVIKSAPVRRLPRFVDTKNGDFHDLKKSGLLPVYIYQPKFGNLPKYLIRRIRDAAKQEENLRDQEVRQQPLCRYVTQEERAELLGGLKHNWEELQKVYQGLPVLTDTIPKAMRKTKLENNLKQLEKDILLVENHPYIYVYDSDKSAH